ncbi:hypothetical protein HON36_02345 [Candidatus Parcubacteria bacterium]|jgi:hypothetical protein|nr:hypothetical protein [Candidatus Parcubacteria bacterium]MBT7228071.1 hypothetical protein [Candidatus Parcubacteria bacterium]
MKTECQMLRDYFSQDLAGDFGHFKNRLATFEETRDKGNENDGVDWWQGRVRSTMGLMASQVDKAFTDTPSGKKFKIKKYFSTSTQKQEVDVEANFRKHLIISSDVTIKIGDTYTAGGDKPKLYTIKGFESKTDNVIVLWLERKLGVKKKRIEILSKNIFLDIQLN